ncbi:hypothetical protein [Neptuniibacter sp. CAU 1671]|uniref:hypothetical protein n=1 Tax=Neptuniibacter sp. CAU 1671 TaxID=3032593 RepID=UPI0023DCA710|nr:hypothetical protein [Neptuniibacter sp. CAU 1671]MDF2181192.1 hypothetical protein [Neptuniibacter sp. CAU 1671]
MKWIVLTFWLLMSSFYLYYIGFAVPKEFSFDGFILFTLLLAGGGLSYDIASKMFAIPSYRGHWRELLTRMGLILIGHGLVISGIYLAGLFSAKWGETLSISFGSFVAVLGMLLACVQAYKAEATFKKLRSMFA